MAPAAINPELEPGCEVNDLTCIRCYCCHEFCPVKAIELKQSGLGKYLNFRKLADAGTQLLGKIVAIFKREKQ